MIDRSRILARLAAISGVLLAGGCELVRMEVDPALAGVAPLAVLGSDSWLKDPQIRFGEWRTASIHDSWVENEHSSVRAGPMKATLDKLSRQYQFELTTGSGPITAQCFQHDEILRRNLKHDGWTIPVGGAPAAPSNRVPLECTYVGAGGGTLSMLDPGAWPRPHDADVGFGGERWVVTQVNRTEGMRPNISGGRSGFAIRREGVAIAAVETINGGRVWIAPTLSRLEQDRAAAILTTLLMYGPLVPPPDTDDRT